MKDAQTTAKVPANAAAPEVSSVKDDTGMGEVKIHENVISALVRKAVMEVEGVARLSGSQLVDIIAETVGSRRMQDRAIAVIISDDGRISIDLKVNLKFGYKIPEVTLAIQKGVIAEVENITGKSVTKVNVIVQELEQESEPAEEENAEADNLVIPPQH